MKRKPEPHGGFDASEGIEKMVEDALKDEEREIRKVNILIAGRTGVGKSTLINAVFRGELAATGQGEPVTKETRKITKEGHPLAIYDTKGLELEEYPQIVDELMELVRLQKGKTDDSEHIHIAWICVNEGSSRVEKAEIELHRRLAQHMETLGVITQAINDDDEGFKFKEEVQRLLKTENVVQVLALPKRFRNGITIEPRGLSELVEATNKLIPEGFRRAFATAQKVNFDLKKREAHKAVRLATLEAVAAGATPVPGADILLLVPIQLKMLVKISKIFEVEVSSAFLMTLVGAMAGSMGTALTARVIFARLVKLFPGPGTVAGAAIGATTAAAFTTGLGELYIGVLANLFKNSGGEVPLADDVNREFKNRLAAQ